MRRGLRENGGESERSEENESQGRRLLEVARTVCDKVKGKKKVKTGLVGAEISFAMGTS